MSQQKGQELPVTPTLACPPVTDGESLGKPSRGLSPAVGCIWARLCVASALAPWGPLTPARALQGIDQAWPLGSD